MDASSRPSGPPLDVLAVVAAGGAIGGAARFAVNRLLPHSEGQLPWNTLVENVSGCLLLGALLVLLLEVGRPGRYARPFWGVGVLGGYTTFSTYTADAVALVRDGRSGVALGYLAGSVLLGLAAAWTGQGLARALARGRRR